ncbi:polyprenyl synthetase family protein [Paenibacillus sp. P25]|nr:polyprenyl synthetase family protein [Paenibacillus sp. P25]
MDRTGAAAVSARRVADSGRAPGIDDVLLDGRGKRLRPILVLAAAEALGGNLEAALPAALAVEMIHTYSLIHDDLPAMDNDDFRRGKPTNHKVFGEAMAILAGDALADACILYTRSGLPPARRSSRSDRGFGGGAFASGGCARHGRGQAADMKGEQGLTRIEELEFIHLHKTSDLIVFSLKAGGRIAGATDAQLEALERFGTCVGLAFQIQDDILDLVGDEQKLGKPVQSDVKQQKVTYPYFIGIDASRAKVEDLTREAKTALVQGGIARPRLVAGAGGLFA